MLISYDFYKKSGVPDRDEVRPAHRQARKHLYLSFMQKLSCLLRF